MMNASPHRVRRSLSSFILHPSSFFLGLAFLLFATSALALDVPPSPHEWVTDGAGILDASAASALNEKLRNFESQSGVQFLIYTFPSLEGEALEDFTIRCATAWKAGNKKYDNGLVLFVFKQERKVRIEVGYGLEGTVTDAVSSRVIRDDIAPHFRNNEDYAGGLNAAADHLIAIISGKEAPVPPSSPGASSTSSSSSGRSSDGTFPQALIFLIVMFAIFVLPRLFMSRRGTRSSGCGGCFWPMFLLGGGGRGITFGGGGGGFGGGGFGGGGGFSGGGGSFGGGGASGGW